MKALFMAHWEIPMCTHWPVHSLDCEPQEPITMTPSPEWPFQQIVMDIFHVAQVTYMALQTGSDLTDWESTFTNAGITMASAKIYAQTFSSEGITRETMHMLDQTMLKELGIKSMGDILIILKLAK